MRTGPGYSGGRSQGIKVHQADFFICSDDKVELRIRRKGTGMAQTVYVLDDVQEMIELSAQLALSAATIIDRQKRRMPEPEGAWSADESHGRAGSN